MLEVSKEKLKSANDYLVQANGSLSYKTILLEILPDILDLDIHKVSATELVGKNFFLYDHIKREHKDEYPALLSALALSVPNEKQ